MNRLHIALGTAMVVLLTAATQQHDTLDPDAVRDVVSGTRRRLGSTNLVEIPHPRVHPIDSVESSCDCVRPVRIDGDWHLAIRPNAPRTRVRLQIRSRAWHVWPVQEAFTIVVSASSDLAVSAPETSIVDPETGTAVVRAEIRSAEVGTPIPEDLTVAGGRLIEAKRTGEDVWSVRVALIGLPWESSSLVTWKLESSRTMSDPMRTRVLDPRFRAVQPAVLITDNDDIGDESFSIPPGLAVCDIQMSDDLSHTYSASWDDSRINLSRTSEAPPDFVNGWIDITWNDDKLSRLHLICLD